MTTASLRAVPTLDVIKFSSVNFTHHPRSYQNYKDSERYNNDSQNSQEGGVMQEAGNRSVKQLAQEENEMLLRLINLRAKGAAESTSVKRYDQTT